MKTTQATQEFSDQWSKLIDAAKETKKELAPNEITRGEFCRRTGMTKEEADNFVRRLIKERKAEIIYRTVDSHRQKIYRLLI